MPSFSFCFVERRPIMTKARARERAKARAAAKAVKPATKDEQKEVKAIPPGKFDAKSSAVRSIKGSSGFTGSSVQRRGSQRSG